MAEYVKVEEAIPLPGLRVVLTPGVPGPWSESAKAILHVKRLNYVKVRQDILGENAAMRRWTAQTSAPVAAWNDEPPRAHWIDQLYLFERLAPEPSLIPEDIDQRMRMFGFAHELMGENGFIWNRRHIMVRDYTAPDKSPETRRIYTALGEKYWYSEAAGAAAAQRSACIVERLSSQLQQQREQGSAFLIGNTLSALDLYWACCAALIDPLPQSQCNIPDMFRDVYTNRDPLIADAVTPELMAHRDVIYEKYLQLPVDL